VNYISGMYGTFREWVIFEFSCGSKLVRKLSVDVGSEDDFIKITKLRETLSVSRWTEDNAEIVRCKLTSNNVKTCLKDPVSISALSTLKQENYVEQMHLLLDIEEARRNDLLNGYVHFFIFFVSSHNAIL